MAHDFVSLEVEALALLAWLRAGRGATEDAKAAASAAMARLDAEVSVQRQPRARMLIARTYEYLGAGDEAKKAWTAARRVIESQVERLRGEGARQRFRATHVVQTVLSHTSHPA